MGMETPNEAAFSDESQKVDDVEKAQVMAQAGNQERSDAADWREGAQKIEENVKENLSDPNFLQKPKEGEYDRAQYRGVNQEKQKHYKFEGQMSDERANDTEEWAGKKFEQERQAKLEDVKKELGIE